MYHFFEIVKIGTTRPPPKKKRSLKLEPNQNQENDFGSKSRFKLIFEQTVQIGVDYYSLMQYHKYSKTRIVYYEKQFNNIITKKLHVPSNIYLGYHTSFRLEPRALAKRFGFVYGLANVPTIV